MICASSVNKHLFVITKENLDGQPAVTTDLEAALEVIQLIYLVGCKVPAIELKVLSNAFFGYALWNYTPSLL